MRTVKVLPRPSVLGDLDRAAVQPDKLLHEREADAGAFVGAPARAFDAMEALEQAGQLGLGNAGAGVAHRAATASSALAAGG